MRARSRTLASATSRRRNADRSSTLPVRSAIARHRRPPSKFVLAGPRPSKPACAKRMRVSSFSFSAMPTDHAIIDLAAALRERLAIIADEESRRHSTKHRTRLQAISDKIDQLQAALPQPIDPQLAHYLQRRSYDKALDFIENTARRSTAH